ncbi:MAG: hypothetical protein ABIH75_01975 [Candidatus Omnitrophota bacterium]
MKGGAIVITVKETFHLNNSTADNLVIEKAFAELKEGSGLLYDAAYVDTVSRLINDNGKSRSG